jgi:hypothetical protein
MTGTVDGFKEAANKCIDLYDVDRVAFSWLRIMCIECNNEHADKLVDVLEGMLKP